MSLPAVEVGSATLYRGDWRDVDLSAHAIDAVVSDPPYGMGWDADSRRFTGGGRARTPIVGDDEPFQPMPWITYPECILFGYQHWAPRAPFGTILVWCKKSSQALGTFLSDAELAWQKGGHGVYVYECVDSNHRRRHELNSATLPHPTQKPERLMRWCVRRLKGGRCIVDPFMGTGTTGVAAVEEGREFVGVEIVPEFFDLACRRIDAAQRQVDIFAGRTP